MNMSTYRTSWRKYHALAVALISACLAPIASCFVIVTTPTAGGIAPQRCLFVPRTTCCSSSSAPPAPAAVLSVRTRRPMPGSNKFKLRARKKKSGSGRPSLDDVERLSRGQAAKKRGTGSRGVCHRLNESERKVRTLVCSCFSSVVLL